MLDSSTNSPPPPSPVNLSSPTAPKTEPPSDPVGGGGGHSRSLEELSRHLPRFTPVPSGRTGLFSESQQCTGLSRGLALRHASSPQVCARQQKAVALQGPPRPFLRAFAGGDALRETSSSAIRLPGSRPCSAGLAVSPAPQDALFYETSVTAEATLRTHTSRCPLAAVTILTTGKKGTKDC